MNEQLGFEGMPTRLFTCTPSKLTAWQDCPRRYRMTYLDRPRPAKGAPWAHNSLGASVHNALRAWWEEPLERRTSARAASLLDQQWLTLGYRDTDQELTWKQRARDWIESYVDRLDPADEPLGVERSVATRTDRLALSGRVDRIDLRDEQAVIVDYKTGRRPLTVDDARSSLALAIYVLCARRTLRRPAHRVELHHLPTDTVLAFDHTEETLARHLSRAEASAADIVAATDTLEAGADRDELFPPRTGPLCGTCDFRAHCPEGQAATPAKESWSALALDP